MNSVVYKYEKWVDDVVSFDLPINAEILHVDLQNGDQRIDLWALVNPDKKKTEKRTIRIAGTGHPIDPSLKLKYINTFTVERRLWFHVFEIK